MKNKCTKCQQIRKASGVSYLKCCECKQKASDKRKKNKKKKTKQSMGGDIADYLDEEIVPYEELDESEKAACQMAAFLISGMILVIAGIVIPLF